MASASFLGAGTGATGTTATIAVPYPAGLAAGNVLILQARTYTGTGMTTPAGWTLITSEASSGFHAAYWKAADGTESGSLNVTFTGTAPSWNASGQFARMYRVNAATTSPTEGVGSESGTSTTVPDRTVTTSGTGRLAVNLAALGGNFAIGAFSGMTGGTWSEAVSEFATTTGRHGTLQIQTATMLAAGTINGGTTTVSAAVFPPETNYYSILGFALKPGSVLTGEATETDLAQSVAAVKTPTGLHATVGQATQTSLAQPITAFKTAAEDVYLYYAVDFGNGFEEMSATLVDEERVRSAVITRGRPFNLDIVEAGTMQSLLKNGDAQLDPSNADGQWYGQILPLLPTRVLRRRNGITYELFQGPIERLQPQWIPPDYQDMAVDAADSFDVFSSEILVSDKSTMTTLLAGTNNDLTFTAVEAGGQGDDITVTYVVAGVATPLSGETNEPLAGNAWAQVQPATGNARTPIIRDIPVPVGSTPELPILSVSLQGSDITINVATDGGGAATSTAAQVKAMVEADPTLSALVDVSYPAGNNGTGVVTAMAQTSLFGGKWPQESTGQRITRILDLIGWPPDQRNLDDGVSFVTPRGFALKENVSALAHMQEVADSELGYIFMSGADVLTFHDGSHRTTATRSTTPQVVFSDDGTGFNYVAIEPSFDKDRIVNEASVSTGVQNASPQTASDLFSQDGTGSPPAGATNLPPGGFRKRSISRSTQLAHDADAAAQAQAIVDAFAYPRYRFDSITTYEPPDQSADLPFPEYGYGTGSFYGEGVYGEGTYGDSSFTYSYQWQDSADGLTGWANIVGATAHDYVIVSGELGKWLRCQVTALDVVSGLSTTVATAATLQVSADSTSSWVESVLSLELGDLITLRTTPPGNNTTTSYDAFVESIVDEIIPGQPWKRTLRLSSLSQSITPAPVDPGGDTSGAILNSLGGPLVIGSTPDSKIS